MGKLKKLEEELKFYLMVFLIAGIFFVFLSDDWSEENTIAPS